MNSREISKGIDGFLSINQLDNNDGSGNIKKVLCTANTYLLMIFVTARKIFLVELFGQ